MSVDALRWALKVSGISATEKLVLAILGDFAGEDGLAYPRQSTLAERVGVSRKCINQTLGALASKELIEPVDVEVPRKRCGAGAGRFQVQVFQLRVGQQLKLAAAPEPEPAPDVRVTLGNTDRVTVGDTAEPAPCNRGLLDRVTLGNTDRVTVGDTALIGIELQKIELQKKEEKNNSHVSAAAPATAIPPSRPGRVLQEDLDRVASCVNEFLGLSGRGVLERDVFAWESVYRDCDGNAEEACAVAAYGRERCRGVGLGLTARSLAKNYRSWCAAAHQTTGGADVAAERRAKRRQELLGTKHA